MDRHRPLFSQGPGEGAVADELIDLSLDVGMLRPGMIAGQDEIVAVLVHEEEKRLFKGDEAANSLPRFRQDHGIVEALVDAALEIAEGSRHLQSVDCEPFDILQFANPGLEGVDRLFIGMCGFHERRKNERYRIIAGRTAP